MNRVPDISPDTRNDERVTPRGNPLHLLNSRGGTRTPDPVINSHWSPPRNPHHCVGALPPMGSETDPKGTPRPPTSPPTGFRVEGESE